jgi:2-C-methyl-D-erythritol 4-phosphate cytidylyltransferase
MNIGILLAAGRSSRFKSDKQLYEINGKSVISFSVDLLSRNLDKLIIVANSKNYKSISTLSTIIVINDTDTRIRSIGIALDYISGHMENVKNIIIHDGARPFITQNNIDELLTVSQSYSYAQYYLNLVNGLAKRKGSGYEIVDRKEYIELCTPVIADYKIYSDIFRNHIDKIESSIEALPILDLHGIPYKLIEGKHKHLRKITTIEDVDY